jgi:mediator of RNA polymerase II transcription subunit 12
MWALRTLIAHSGLDSFPSTAKSLFDVATLLSDSMSEDVRKQLAQWDIANPADGDRCTFIFGSLPLPDGWVDLTAPVNSTSSGQADSSPQAQSQPASTGLAQYPGQPQHPQSIGPGTLQRSMSQQHLQQPMQSQGQLRTYSQLPQQSKMLPQQLQRMGSHGQSGQPTNLQQLQQMQALAQQRNVQPSLNQQQRTYMASAQSLANGKIGGVKHEKVEMRPVPFALNRWEILPESGSNMLGNETAISLSLFGARKA